MKIKRIIFFVFALIGLSTMSVIKVNAQIFCDPPSKAKAEVVWHLIQEGPYYYEWYESYVTWEQPVNIDGILIGYNIYRDGVLYAGLIPTTSFQYYDSEYYNGEPIWYVQAIYDHCESEIVICTSVITYGVGYITQTKATLNGMCVGSNISTKGFEYKLSTESTFTQVFVSSSSFFHNLTDLIPGASYNYRAFITSTEIGTIYGSTRSFTTQQIGVVTLNATNITSSGATLNGTTYTDDVALILEQGFILTKPTGNDTINVSNTITNLTYNATSLNRTTTYSYKTYCATAYGTVYGGEVQFTTPFNQEGTTNLIEDIYDMLYLAKLVEEENSFEGQKFKLVNNIILPNTPNNIKAIGRYDDNYSNRRPFCGEFDGNNKKIINVYIDHPNTPYQGLFGYARNADIHNLGIENITASGRNYTGGMIAYSENSKITDCYVSGGTLYALSYCGGLIGYQTPGTNSIITSCYNNNCSVSGNKYVGGLLGYSNQGTVRNSYVAAQVGGLEGTTGAIIGGALDVLFYNWWYNNSITDLPPIGENLISGKRDGVGISSEEMRTPEFVNTLNQGLPIPAWKMDYNPPINNGFPILIWQPQFTGIVNLEKESSINLYPNPVQDSFIISFENDTKGQVIIYDMLGKVVMSQEFSDTKTTINIVNLSRGIYNVRVVTEGKTVGVSKIVKQ